MSHQHNGIRSLMEVKAKILSIGLVSISDRTAQMSEVQNRKLARLVTKLNLHAWPWLFLRLNDQIRIRVVVDPTGGSELELVLSDSGTDLYEVIDRDKGTIARVTLEESIYHCPGQFFFAFYTRCVNDCKYCPSPLADPSRRDTIERMIWAGHSVDITNLKGIGITTAVPGHLTPDDLAEEMAQAVKALRSEWGNELPIGVSPFPCSRRSIERLREAGANEIRINSETFDIDLHKIMCPNKDLDQILVSLEAAVDVFGRNMVSSNIIVGLGETNDDIIRGVEELCEMGVIPTLYPLDPIPGRIEQLKRVSDGKAARPSARRLVNLAEIHKEALDRYRLDPTKLRTMCPACAASHLMPGIDL